MLNNKKIGIKLLLIALFGITLFIVWNIEHSPFPPDISIGQTPLPPGLTPSSIPSETISPTPAGDIRTWGERFRDPTIPEVPGVTWQTYTNKEFGFEMEHPVGWGVQETNAQISREVTLEFYVNPYKKYTNPLFLNLSKGTIHDNFSHRGNYWINRIKKGLAPDANIKGIDVYIDTSEWHSTQNDLGLYFEKNGFIYSFQERMGASSYENNNIIEHMIKTLHFLK